VTTRLSVQTKLAILVSFTLWAAGFVVFWSLELNHSLRGQPFGTAFLISAFQAVTPRTAGFNTVLIDQLQQATLVFLIMLMVIGASPVSTGGGIKTVNLGILLLALRAMVTRRDRVEAFGRTIPPKTLFAALSLFVLYVFTASVGIFLIALFDPHLPARDQVFEVISALSTVGLSTGITGNLSPQSKLVLCAAMFIGRVGPISLVFSVFQNRRVVEYDFPEEEVVVG
jgi:trk system potassium uptake protein TrkH